jgi:hypothetical protein
MSCIRATLQLVAPEDISAIIKADIRSGNVTTNAKDYTKDNYLAYTVLCNTWMISIQKWSRFGWCGLVDHMKKKGLLETIRFASEQADLILDNRKDELHPYVMNLLHDVLRYSHPTNERDDIESDINRHPMAAILFLLRYPKRFSPLHADVVEEEGYTSWLNCENRNKLRSRKELPHWLVIKVREEISNMIDWDSFLAEAEGCDDFQLSNGSCVEGRAPISKLVAITEENPNALHSIMGFSLGGYPKTTMSWDPLTNKDHPGKVIAVPKSYKAPRMIAPEPAYRQARAKVLFNILDKYLPKDIIDLHNQSHNQLTAYLGSLDGSWGTIDLSSASDSILKTMLWEFFPANVANFLAPYLSQRVTVRGKLRTLHMLSTSGNCLTFVLEAIVFSGIGLAAISTVDTFAQEESTGALRVYGDDIAIKTRYAETCVQFLELFGFIVNRSKSFISPEFLYRESCGEEFYQGINTSAYYFPRRPVRGSITSDKITLDNTCQRDGFTEEYYDTTVSLVKLQQALFMVSYEASEYLKALIREAKPRMTESPVGDTAANDVWGYLCANPIPNVPFGRFIRPNENVEEVARAVVPKGIKYTVRQAIRPDGTTTQCLFWSNAVDGVGCDLHYVPSVSYKAFVPKNDVERFIYDYYRYDRFLREGPRYLDDLSRLLRVSSDPRKILDTPDRVNWLTK